MSANGTNPDKLKILICLLYYVPHRTGLTIHVQRVAEELVRRGHEVTVLTARYSKDLPRDETVYNGVRIVRLWAPIRVSRGMIMPAYPWAALGLLLQHDVVSIHTPMMETALISLLATLTGRKVVATHHGDLILPKGFLNRMITAFVFGMYKFMAKRAGRLIAYSHDYADNSYYLRPFRDKVSVIYPPIEMPLPDAQRVAALRAAWSHNGEPVIGYAGRFVEEKRPDLAIRALDVVIEKYPDVRLVFAGEYDIKYEDTWQRHQALVQKHQDHLIFLGLVEDMQALADFYAACDVIVLPSDTECFALVQVEAMLCGTPVVMTDIPGGRVPVTVTGMGKLAQKGDWRSIGEALVDVLDNPDAYHRSREYIEKCFSFQETVDRYEKHLRNHARSRHD
ncbi:MAG: glycosyltransferase family 1 protein [Chloroflexi bacterium]|nr:MAG: glycosyltransferase family 1 protein [Phototrophicales bacterium]RMF78129.1 MAG: glycosyltransferase family 1 protein [Chloroflexota bacterium]